MSAQTHDLVSSPADALFNGECKVCLRCHEIFWKHRSFAGMWKPCKGAKPEENKDQSSS